MAIGAFALQFFVPLAHGRGELLKHLFRVLPVYARIGNAHAILEPWLAFLGNLLRACCEMVSTSPWYICLSKEGDILSHLH